MKHAYLESSMKELVEVIKAGTGSTEYNGNDILTKAWKEWSVKISNNKIEKAELYILHNSTKMDSCFGENIVERLEKIDSYTNSSIVYFKN
ncbi:hypothetical protein, partial [Salmonella sp. s51228]|uniref:hypothetical protein n=1 Tax=Salmonella sp. s51228 TaxID=3159652 RepID=UPI0039816E3D